MDRRKIALRYVRTWFLPEPWQEITWLKGPWSLIPQFTGHLTFERVTEISQPGCKESPKICLMSFSWLFPGVGQGLMTRAANRFQMNTFKFCSTCWLHAGTHNPYEPSHSTGSVEERPVNIPLDDAQSNHSQSGPDLRPPRINRPENGKKCSRHPIMAASRLGESPVPRSSASVHFSTCWPPWELVTMWVILSLNV